MKNSENLGRYDLDALLQTLGTPKVTFCGRTFEVNESYKNFEKLQKLVKEDPEKSLEILVEGVLGKDALEHLRAVEETMTARMVKYLAISISAAVYGMTIEEAERRFPG